MQLVALSVAGSSSISSGFGVAHGGARYSSPTSRPPSPVAPSASKLHGRVRPAEAVSILQNLRTKGVAAEPFLFTAQSVGRLALALYQAIKSGTLAIWRDDDLVAELLSVRLVEKGPGQFRLDHASSGHDDMAVCLAMATATLLERPVTGGWGHLVYARTCPTCQATMPESAVECLKCGAELVVVNPTPLSENPWAHVYGVSDKTLPKRGSFGAAANAGQRGWFG